MSKCIVVKEDSTRHTWIKRYTQSNATVTSVSSGGVDIGIIDWPGTCQSFARCADHDVVWLWVCDRVEGRAIRHGANWCLATPVGHQ